MSLLDKIPMQTAVIMALFLGLAPFVPEPHVLEKLRMLAAGELARPIDIGDLLFHGAPWLLLFAKLVRLGAGVGKGQGDA
ncbi:MAG: RND transporter [Marinosulfonomonas sp.]|nr:RND transporter [Marinosulfonomonas sp.]